MGSFPTYAAPTRKVNPYPNVSFSHGIPDNAFGRRFGLTLQQSGALLSRRVTEMAEEDARNAARQALTAADAEAIGYLYGTAESPGALELQGSNADGSAAATQERLGEIGKRYAADLDPRAQARFMPDWNTKSRGYFTSVSRNAATQRVVARGETMDEALRQAQKKIELDPLNVDAVNGALQSALVAMDENNKSDEFIASRMDVLNDIAADSELSAAIMIHPMNTARALTETGALDPFPEMPPAVKEEYISKALTEHYSRLTRENVEYSRRIKENDRQKKAVSDATWSEAKTLQMSGGLTAQWAYDNRLKLGGTRYGNVVDLIMKPNATHTDESTWFDIKELALGLGPDAPAVDVSKLVEDAVASKLLPIEKGEKLIKMSKDSRFGAAERMLDSYTKPGPMNQSMVAKGIYGEAHNELETWWDEHPDADSDEAMKAARAIIKRVLPYNAQLLVNQGRKPKDLEGTPLNFNLEVTRENLITRLIDKYGSKDAALDSAEFRYENEAIERYAEAKRLYGMAEGL